VFKPGDGGAKEENPEVERPTCHVCKSGGPFGRSLECTFKLENSRHRFLLCTSHKCEAKFEKECLTAAEKGVEAGYYTKVIKQMAKRNSYFCPRCFQALKDVPLPKCEDCPPPPPPMKSSMLEEEELSCGNATAAPAAPLEDLDFSKCVAIVKEADPSPVAGGSKKGKKQGKKQGGNQLQRELVQALFFEESAAERATEEGELLDSPRVVASSPKPAQTAPAFFIPAAMSQVLPKADQRRGVWADNPSSNAAMPQVMAPSQASKPAGVAARTAPAGATARAAPATAAADPAGAAARFVARAADAAERTQPLELPPGWKTAWSSEGNQHYYYHVDTREVSWDLPTAAAGRACHQEEVSATSASTTYSQSSTAAPRVCSQPTTPSAAQSASSLEYVCIHTWKPREADAGCIRVVHGERVALESETLSGWGIGTVVPEQGEDTRCGHFPRWALSDNPAPYPEILTPGSRVTVCEDFTAPTAGYLSICEGDVFIAKYQVAPYVWVWIEHQEDPCRRGWVPEAVLRRS